MTGPTGNGTTVGDARARSRANESQARSEMRVALAKVSRMRPLLYVALGGTLIGMIAAVLQATNADSATPLVLAGTGTALVLVAILILDRWPVVATMPLALLHTTVAIHALATGVAWDYMDGRVRSFFWAIYCWIIVVAAWRASRLMKAHPDLYLSKWMRGEGGEQETRHVARALEENRRYKSKERQYLLGLAVVLGVLLAAGILGLALRSTQH